MSVRYKHKEDQLTVRVAKLRRFDSFAEFYRSDLFAYADFGDLTIDEFLSKMHTRISKKDENNCGVMAIKIEPTCGR